MTNRYKLGGNEISVALEEINQYKLEKSREIFMRLANEYALKVRKILDEYQWEQTLNRIEELTGRRGGIEAISIM